MYPLRLCVKCIWLNNNREFKILLAVYIALPTFAADLVSGLITGIKREVSQNLTLSP